VGRVSHPIPFGAPDRAPTDLFFLLACPDDRLHLHTLARLCLMAQKSELLYRLRTAETAMEMEEEIISAEGAVIRSADE
jgi:mannitol/fructose-specific phosphotransferase system IIA component (Ntr-type)